jgi:3-oxoacyl-[acyl-carrier protein] reductase
VDVCDEKQVNHFAKEVRKITKKVDVLINNAGIAAMNHFMMTPVDTARRLMDTNYMGSFIASRAFISLLRKSDHPRIINFSSIAVPFCLEGEMAYASSKSAIETMTRILAKELASFNITVNAVGPTPIKTDLIAKVPEEKLNKILDAQAVHRFGEFADVINVIDFYVKPESDFITGQVLYLGGVS